MPHGGPDWGVSAPIETVYGVDDLGELAARLNVVNTFDRRGNVVWWDDFEDNINKWQLLPIGNGSAVALSTDQARSGANSCKLTTGDISGASASILRIQGLIPSTTQIGFEISFQIDDDLILEVPILVYRSLVSYRGAIRYDYNNSKLQYYGTDGTYHDLQTGLSLLNLDAWHTIKFVVDFSDTGEYIRVLADNQAPDVSDVGVYKSTTTYGDLFQITVSAISSANGNKIMYVDDAIITQNEP